jgi:hypothetical protein
MPMMLLNILKMVEPPEEEEVAPRVLTVEAAAVVVKSLGGILVSVECWA